MKAVRSGSVCLRATPWLMGCCALLLLAGLPLWFISSSAATSSTKAVLDSASIDAPIIATVETIVSTVQTVVLVLVIAALLLVVLLALLGAANAARRLRQGSAGAGALRSYLAVGVTTGTALWLAMLAVVLLLAVSTTWFLGAWAGSVLLDTAIRFSSSAQVAAQQAVKSGNQLVTSVRDIQLLALEAAPQEVQDTQWYRDFKSGVQQMNSTTLLQAVGGSSTGSSSTPCGTGCISLDFLADLAGLSNNCICLTNTINDLQGGLVATRQHMLPALIGLALMYLAASWLLIRCAASYVHAKRDLRERRLVAGLAPVRGSYTSGASGVLVDAAVDIQGAPSLKGLQQHAGGNPAGSGDTGYISRDQQVAGAQAVHPTAPLMVADGFDRSSHTQLFGGQRPVQPGSQRLSQPGAGAMDASDGGRQPHRVVCVGDREHASPGAAAGWRSSAPGNAAGLL